MDTKLNFAVINDEISQDLGISISLAKDLLFEGLEIRSCYGLSPHNLSLEHIKKIKNSLDNCGLKVAGFDPPVFKSNLPETEITLLAEQNKFLEFVKKAEILESPFIRIFSFYRNEQVQPKLAAKIIKEIIMQSNSEIPLLLETGTRTNTPNIESALEFLDELSYSNIGILWDPGNTIFSGYNTSPFPYEYQIGKDLIRHVHLKDPKGTREYVKFGDGDLPCYKILETLYQDNFRGWVSLETHWRNDKVLSQQERDEPWGNNFSLGGYEASKVCMEIMNQMMEKIHG